MNSIFRKWVLQDKTVDKVFDKTLYGYLRKMWYQIEDHCSNVSSVNNEFEVFADFFNHVVYDLGFDSLGKITGRDVYRLKYKGNYSSSNIEFLTNEEHGNKYYGVTIT